MTKSWSKGYEMDDAEYVFEQDMNQIIASFRGIVVLPTGLELEVTETGGGANNYANISTGKAWVEDTLGEVTSTQQVQIAGVTAGGKARIDSIYIDSGTNQVGKIVGTEATSGSEKAPDIPEDKCVLAFVTVTDTEPPTVANADITDRRFFGYYVESDLIGADAITEDKITFNTSTGHDHDGSDSKTADHVNLDNKGTNTHAEIDTHVTSGDSHIASSANPHSVSNSQVLPNIADKYVVVDKIRLGSGINSSQLTSFQDYGAPAFTWVYNSSAYSGQYDTSKFRFIYAGSHKVSNVLGTSTIELYNISDTQQVINSTHTTSEIDFAIWNITYVSLVTGKRYKARHKIDNGSYSSSIGDAYILIVIPVD